MKKKKIIALIILSVFIISAILGIINYNKKKEELISVKSEKQLLSIYNSGNTIKMNMPILLGMMPFSFFTNGVHGGIAKSIDSVAYDIDTASNATEKADGIQNSSTTTSTSSSSENDYSTTNIQVENVDEADITKTDGKYIYSISENNVIITNVENPTEMKVETKLNSGNFVPEDMLLYQNRLAVISTEYNRSKYNTKVTIYDISNKANVKITEEYILYSKYYTSRCINGKLIVICSESMRKEDDKIVTYYTENNTKKDIGLDNIKYLRNQKEKYQTIISSIDLNKEENVKVSEYLFNVQNAYVSENYVYLLNSNYSNKSNFLGDIKNLLIKGVIAYASDLRGYDYSEKTTIYKFKIDDDGSLRYENKTKTEGHTINQFSIDEYNGNLRVALQGNDGSRIVVFDEKLREIGSTEYLSKGEKMYSTRFLGNKAYMVTYKNTDPLYVIDLSNPSNPNVLGKLEIPGYSTYLHPYDENHLIGIGLQTEEKINRNSSGKVISTTAQITGMKMALFDVSDVKNPVQISQTIIGDRKTTSAILTNHKALLFSKEKEIIAIPVNKYPSDFEITVSGDDISKMENSYTKYNKDYTAEGYFVYNINLEKGFELKGIVEHEKNKTTNYYSSYYSSKLLRGMWIKNNLFTISEDMIKVNDLDDLSSVSELKINEK